MEFRNAGNKYDKNIFKSEPNKTGSLMFLSCIKVLNVGNRDT